MESPRGQLASVEEEDLMKQNSSGNFHDVVRHPGRVEKGMDMLRVIK